MSIPCIISYVIEQLKANFIKPIPKATNPLCPVQGRSQMLKKQLTAELIRKEIDASSLRDGFANQGAPLFLPSSDRANLIEEPDDVEGIAYKGFRTE